MEYSDIDLLKISLNNTYYENLIEYCEKNGIDCDNYKTELVENKKIISSNKIESEKEEDMYNDDYLYRKPWNRLTEIHKIIKIREFVEKLNCSDENINNLKKILEKMVYEKKLTKKNTVVYDSKEGHIISIPILTYKNGEYVIVK
jgi:hypothetical protein